LAIAYVVIAVGSDDLTDVVEQTLDV
jgi:hypothetical protein